MCVHEISILPLVGLQQKTLIHFFEKNQFKIIQSSINYHMENVFHTRRIMTECHLCKEIIIPEFPSEYHVEICMCRKLVHRRCLDKHISDYRQGRIDLEVYKQQIECDDCYGSYRSVHYHIHDSLNNSDQTFAYGVLIFVYIANFFFGSIVLKTIILCIEYGLFILFRRVANLIVYGKSSTIEPVSERCIICHDADSTEPVYLYCACQASTHRTCLQSWVVQKSGWQCPLCRRKMIPLPSRFRTDYLIATCVALCFYP